MTAFRTFLPPPRAGAEPRRPAPRAIRMQAVCRRAEGRWSDFPVATAAAAAAARYHDHTPVDAGFCFVLCVCALPATTMGEGPSRT